MSLQLLDSGEDLKQFKKVVITAGPLKGARYTDVCHDDLRKAARSYKHDPRFNQYAKRVMSEKALGNKSSIDTTSQSSRTWRTSCSEWVAWIVSRARGRVTFVIVSVLFARLVIAADVLCGGSKRYHSCHQAGVAS